MTTEDSKQSQPKEADRVVILGSGYGGIHACQTLIQNKSQLDNLEIVLLSDVDHLLYVTMIYEIPAGNLSPSAIRQSVRTMIDGQDVDFMQGRATRVDVKNQTVHYNPVGVSSANNKKNRKLTTSYDYLVSAIGSQTNFYDTPGAEKHAYELKRLDQAKRLKNRLINNFERATLETSASRIEELLSVVVVGGGATGATLTAKIADLLNDELAQAFPDLIEHAQITVIEASDQLVSRAGSWFAENMTATLKGKKRVSVQTGELVDEVRANGVKCGDTFLRSDCVVWTAGVKARELDFVGGEITQDEHSRRVHVTKKLHAPESENVFVVGDQAWVQKPGSDDPYPMRAQFAVRQGKQAGENILRLHRGRRLEKFHWADKGLVMSAGHGQTFAQIFGFHISGFFATVAYKSVYLMSTIGLRAKARAALEWFMNMFLPRDISEL